MKVSLIAAYGKRGQLGLNNKLPWHIPEDLAKFKKLTLGSTIIMGRKTFESLPRILPDRHHIIITSKNLNFDKKTSSVITIASTVEEALKKCKNKENAWIVGGAQIYNYCIENDLIDEYYLSEVDYNGPADTFINLDKINFDKFIILENKIYPSYKNSQGKIVSAWQFKKYVKKVN